VIVLTRSETPADHDLIHDILVDAFETDAEARLVRALRESPGFDPAFSIVALDADVPIGHILFTPAPVVDEHGVAHPALALGPMGVLRAHQRRGIGGVLVRAGLEACRREGHSLVHVLGHAAYYPRFGFHAALDIACAFDPTGAHFMALSLMPGAAQVRGRVRYLPPFSAF